MAGSFGSLDEVSKTVLPEGEGVTSTLVDSYRQGASYVYDYIVTQKDRPETHIKVISPNITVLCTISRTFRDRFVRALARCVEIRRAYMNILGSDSFRSKGIGLVCHP